MAKNLSNCMASQVMVYQISVYCLSDIGLIRQNNEDSFKVMQDPMFFALADGMGGHQAGEIASKKAVEILCSLLQEKFDPSNFDLTIAESFLKEIIQEVNSCVYQLSRDYAHLRGMGTTLCCGFIHSTHLVFGHVGDSRIYLYRQGKLNQLTQDHSLLRELIDLGQLSEQQAPDFLYKNIITKAIGTEPMVEPAVSHLSLEVGDIVMTCTDGLSDMLTIQEIEGILYDKYEEDATPYLVEKAKQKGGHDNITVILVKIREKYEANLS